uniref:Uncharacterized protein n=1 Tax=Oncorhynchus mykiss TaxID=8022 RepID=A0A8C7SG94_ONCMY
MLQAAERSPRRLQTLSRLSRAQCEPAFICEEHRAPLANLPILVFSVKCQTSCTVLGCKHNPHLWMSGPHITLMESVSDRLSRHMHICGLLEVTLQGSGSAPPAPPCTKTSIPGQINDSRQNNAKSFWESFLLRRRSELLSIIPLRHYEINQQMCRTLPMSQVRILLVLENNICFGKCSSPDSERMNTTQVAKVVTMLEDCPCELKGLCSHSRQGPSLFDPILNW